ncbi:MAG: hypothetical protein QM754_05115 [Tepidisphaeraceae bacterium]
MRRLLVPAVLTTATALVCFAQSTQPATPRDVANDMLKPTTNRLPPLSPVQGDPLKNQTTVNPVDPKARPQTLKREGGYVVDRTGRITKTADGKSFEFNFVSDNGDALQDPPMGLLPNLSLMMVQDQLKLTGRDLKFRVTGMVTEYMGKNYLLLQKVVVVNE